MQNFCNIIIRCDSKRMGGQIRLWPAVFWIVLFIVVNLWIFAREVTINPVIEFVLKGRFSNSVFSSSKIDDDALATNYDFIHGTNSIIGAAAVYRFRSHLQCFSDSGQWVYNGEPRRLPWNVAGDPSGKVCDNRHLVLDPGNVAGEKADLIADQGGDWKVREELKWVWHTNITCPMMRFNRDAFCRLVGVGRNILLVGDSINHELQWVFLNNLLRNYTDVVPSLSTCRTCEGYPVCEDVLGQGSGFRINFIRNDRLSSILNARENQQGNMIEYPWLPYLEKGKIKILLLNRGAHFEADDIYINSLEKNFMRLHAKHPHMLVIYRNTPPGHANCTTYTKPLMKPQDFDLPYHWREFHRQNSLAKNIVESAGYIYMDVETMLSLRPDGHLSKTDCLHYCLPGPLDFVIELLYNIFLLL